MVKEILENAIRQIEVNKTQQLNVVVQKVRTEKIVPYNAELDRKKDRAIAQERENFNAKVAELQADFNAKVEEISKATEMTKASFERATIEGATAEINNRCDTAIEALKKQIAETKE
jgi:hypothetical protein